MPAPHGVCIHRRISVHVGIQQHHDYSTIGTTATDVVPSMCFPHLLLADVQECVCVCV